MLLILLKEICIPPIILPSDYVTVSIRSCPEVGDADYIIGLLDITEYRPVERGVRRVRSLPSQAREVHLFVDQLFKTKGINTIFILIR